MNYQNELNQALVKNRFRSLKAFYEQNTFSFSYEYMRQIFLGLKIPTDGKLEEISKPLGLDLQKLRKLVLESRLDRSILKYYHKASTSTKELTKKKEDLTNKNKKDEKIIGLLLNLNDKQKDQAIAYMRSLGPL